MEQELEINADRQIEKIRHSDYLFFNSQGDALTAHCGYIYNNSLLVGEVARFNSLNSFREIPSGNSIRLDVGNISGEKPVFDGLII